MPRGETDTPSGGAVRRFTLRYWVAIVLVALAATFIAQNREHQQVHVLWISVGAPMWLLLAVLLLVGILVGLLLGRRRRG